MAYKDFPTKIFQGLVLWGFPSSWGNSRRRKDIFTRGRAQKMLDVSRENDLYAD